MLGDEIQKQDVLRDSLATEAKSQTAKADSEKKFEFIEAELYKSKFIDEMKDGFGLKTWPDNSKYKGNWLNNRRHGNGEFTYPDGRKYVGEWKDDKVKFNSCLCLLETRIWRIYIPRRENL